MRSHFTSPPVASQLVKNGAHNTGSRESTTLINKQLYDIWKVPTPEGNSISGPFRPAEFTSALRRLKPGKSPGLGSIYPEFILHAGSTLKSWFCDFLTSCLRQLKIPKIWSCDPTAGKAIGGPKDLSPYISSVPLLQDPWETHLARVEPIIDPLHPQE